MEQYKNSLAGLIRANAAVTLDVIEALEAEMEKQIPDDYKAFLLRWNGGEPEQDEFLIPPTNYAGISRFYGLLPKLASGELRYEYSQMRDRVPKGILPIADASGGNRVCISLRDESFGNIFFWDHELEAEEGQMATFGNLP